MTTAHRIRIALFAAVSVLVDDARIGKLNVTVLLRKVVVHRPARDLVR